jgi:hypothetical protein
MSPPSHPPHGVTAVGSGVTTIALGRGRVSGEAGVAEEGIGDRAADQDAGDRAEEGAGQHRAHARHSRPHAHAAAHAAEAALEGAGCLASARVAIRRASAGRQSRLSARRRHVVGQPLEHHLPLLRGELGEGLGVGLLDRLRGADWRR